MIVRDAWARAQRCILPAFGFYVWQLTSERYRQPYFVRVVNRPVFGMAALWDRTVRDDDDVIESCGMLTVPSNPLLTDATSARMPAILRREDYDVWLSGAPEASALLRTHPQEQMVAHAVSPRINSLKYDDVGLIESVEQRERNCA
jgi:putative SOS response-associated peptidase YedK